MTQHQIEKVSIEVFNKVKEQIKDSLKSLDNIEKDLKENLQDTSKFGFNN